MYTSSDEQSVINDDMWRMWAGKARLRRKAATRKFKVVAEIVFGCLIVGSAAYFLAIRS